jgi:hypothetical protein
MKNKKDKEMIRVIEKWTGHDKHDDLIFFIAMFSLCMICTVILIGYFIDKLFL